MATIKELKEHLKSYNDNDVIAYDIWQVKDVILQAKDLGLTVTEEQAKSILDTVHNNRDSEQGINWDVIQYQIYNEIGD